MRWEWGFVPFECQEICVQIWAKAYKICIFLDIRKIQNLALTSPSSWRVTLPFSYLFVPFSFLVRSLRLLALINWIKNLVRPCRWFWQHLKTVFRARKFTRSFFLQYGKSARSLFRQENVARSNFFYEELARSFFPDIFRGLTKCFLSYHHDAALIG